MITIMIPTVVSKIFVVIGKEKLTYMGYSQGTSQMFYGLATNEDFFADKVNRFTALNIKAGDSQSINGWPQHLSDQRLNFTIHFSEPFIAPTASLRAPS